MVEKALDMVENTRAPARGGPATGPGWGGPARGAAERKPGPGRPRARGFMVGAPGAWANLRPFLEPISSAPRDIRMASCRV